MRLLRGVRASLSTIGDAVWAAVDPDEPLFCDCTPARACVDCSLLAPADELGACGAA